MSEFADRLHDVVRMTAAERAAMAGPCWHDGQNCSPRAGDCLCSCFPCRERWAGYAEWEARCKGSSHEECGEMGACGADCRWNGYAGIVAECERRAARWQASSLAAASEPVQS
jgi:hypothetical protein